MSYKIKWSQKEVDAAIRKVCKDFAEFLVEKNHAYGNSAFVTKTFSKDVSLQEEMMTDPMLKLKVRQEDKFIKMMNGYGYDELEDAENDFVGYYMLIRALKYLRSTSGRTQTSKSISKLAPNCFKKFGTEPECTEGCVWAAKCKEV